MVRRWMMLLLLRLDTVLLPVHQVLLGLVVSFPLLRIALLLLTICRLLYYNMCRNFLLSLQVFARLLLLRIDYLYLYTF